MRRFKYYQTVINIMAERLMIKGPEDCEDSEFSAYETEERVLDINGVLAVSGGSGSPLGTTEYAEVVLDRRHRNREYEIKTEVESFLGMNVKYVWRDVKDYK